MFSIYSMWWRWWQWYTSLQTVKEKKLEQQTNVVLTHEMKTLKRGISAHCLLPQPFINISWLDFAPPFRIECKGGVSYILPCRASSIFSLLSVFPPVFSAFFILWREICRDILPCASKPQSLKLQYTCGFFFQIWRERWVRISPLSFSLWPMLSIW